MCIYQEHLEKDTLSAAKISMLSGKPLTLIWVGGFLPPPSCLFSLNNSGSVNAVNRGFCSVKLLFRDIQAKFGIPPQFPDIEQNSDGGIFNFWISDQIFYKNIVRISNDIDMKLQPVRNLDKRNTTTPNKFDDKVVPANWSLIWSNPEPGIWTLGLTFLSIATFYLAKTENKTKKSLTQLSHYCFG